MNKTTKIALNYGLGLLIMALLLVSLYHQVTDQLSHIGSQHLWPEHTWPFLTAALLLIPANLGIEARKWQLLAGSAIPLSYYEAVKSLLGGIAFSIITPNRVGEYPGRILFLKNHRSTRLISVSVLGACSQLLAILLFGAAGLIYYNLRFPGPLPLAVLAACVLATIVALVCYLRFERWAPYLERIRWLRRLRMYGYMLGRFDRRRQLQILAYACCRFAVFTLQYYLMLRWVEIALPFLDGFLLAALFFWAMAIIPSIALAELGIRGQVSLFLFGAFTTNRLGLLTATTGLWLMNLVVPALLGSLLLLRMRLLR